MYQLGNAALLATILLTTATSALPQASSCDLGAPDACKDFPCSGGGTGECTEDHGTGGGQCQCLNVIAPPSSKKKLKYNTYADIEGTNNNQIAPHIYPQSRYGEDKTDDVPGVTITKRTEDTDKLGFQPKGINSYQIAPETYSSYDAVAKAKGGYFYNTALSKDVNAIGQPGVIKGPENNAFDYVTEHVFEKQNLRDIIQLMTQGRTALNKQVKAADVKGIFDENGIFNQPWPQSAKPDYGDKPVNTAFGCLGHTANGGAKADVTNLEVLDKEINAIKAHVAAFHNPGSGLKDSDSDKPNKQLTLMTEWLDVFKYYGDKDVNGAFNGAYKCLHDTFWPAFAKHPQAQKNYDYAGVFADVTKDHLKKMASVSHDNFKGYYDDAKKYWNGDDAEDDYEDASVEVGKDAINKYMADWEKQMVLDVDALTK